MTDKKIIEILLRDGYHDAARRLAELIAENKRLAESIVPRKGGRKMDTREKLIEILYNSEFAADVETYAEMADHLIANGVTVQQWIPVSERLPEPFVSVLACIPSEAPLPTVHESYIADHGAWVCILEAERYKPGEVTHWMPIPSTEGLK